MRTLLFLAAATALAGCSDINDLLHPSDTYRSAQATETCRYQDQATVGVSRVCNYACADAGRVTTAVGTRETCPQTAQYP